MNEEIKKMLVEVTKRFLNCSDEEAIEQTDRWLKIVHEIMEEE
ncbi:hypothetical protein [Clostridium frigidicarnis]|uniref:Uncharacterized protein n=1 Tax=Clostridium frigidicarnis TaxID=84698 RepID=A0A1I0V3B3_9CLOT|nr:hypothetical protein [Clostridium frigidicarnis]SFA70742.1 hypothetical protein SAMN04488528_1001128 [Clostridium frigidicarnis]